MAGRSGERAADNAGATARLKPRRAFRSIVRAGVKKRLRYAYTTDEYHAPRAALVSGNCIGDQPIYMRAVFPEIAIALIAIVVAEQANRWTKRVRPSPLPAASDAPAASPGVQSNARNRWAATAWGEVRIPVGAGGHYWTAAEINGSRIGALIVDTGASMVVLTYEDAETAGVLPGAADFNVPVQTANGIGRAARARLHLVRVGDLFVENVDAMVAQQGVLSSSLLGMSFLSRLGSFEASGGALVLRR